MTAEENGAQDETRRREARAADAESVRADTASEEVARLRAALAAVMAAGDELCRVATETSEPGDWRRAVEAWDDARAAAGEIGDEQ